ncbi:hypothetical protein A6A06_38490 [Streptomyces sp. CB02923]|uniref:hypothetical protein n=1 Tax=Streptomyces sp. CB02923 TaxID=1718985 RepID=UPI000939756D|nr:hypothetical protein [Streptomyces sp. CB02923]OKI06070.1 hypothetical protein A6A06_38490 [Streptomyces sp. CB02923]
MPTTSSDPSDDPQAHGTPPTEPDAVPAERPREQSALDWGRITLSALSCTAGVALTLTGHSEAGVVLIAAGSVGGGVQVHINVRK